MRCSNAEGRNLADVQLSLLKIVIRHVGRVNYHRRCLKGMMRVDLEGVERSSYIPKSVYIFDTTLRDGNRLQV